MKPTVYLGLVAGSLLAGAVLAGVGAATPLFPDKPLRSHTAIGPIRVLASESFDGPPISIVDAARDRYGQVDALAHVGREPLPWADGALISGLAIRWD